MAAEGRGTL